MMKKVNFQARRWRKYWATKRRKRALTTSQKATHSARTVTKRETIGTNEYMIDESPAARGFSLRAPLAEVYSSFMGTVLRYLGTVAAILLTVYIVPGVYVTEGWVTILLAALVWSVITLLIKPVLKILTLPITILTFGIFSLVLNALLFWAMELIVPGFMIAGFWSAFLGAIVLSILSWLIHMVL